MAIKFVTPEEAVKAIKSGDHIHLSSVASAPQCLIKAPSFLVAETAAEPAAVFALSAGMPPRAVRYIPG